ncbi:unnamed protein product, partial [Candidula unifasciata]
FADVEEEFLHAAEFGDIHCVKRILTDYKDFNSDCTDALGRTALRLAVKNEHLEIVELLLERAGTHQIYEAVLQAISADHTQIAESILKHRRYLEMWKERRKLGDTDGFYKTALSDSQFSPDITPLILAAQKNQFEIVQLLLTRGEHIMKPHKFSCGCQECRNKMKFDQLRLAKYRLNAYRGLASEAYISLSSGDPILTAFELAAELRRLSSVEKHFKSEYKSLADQLSDYVVKLLDRIRTQKELELVLNKTGKPDEEKFESLARFKMALDFEEKKFVAHPSCQQRVVRTWYNGMGKLERAHWPRRLTMLGMFLCAYPFLVLMHIFCPHCKGAKILQFPVVKFVCHAMSFILFLLLIVVSTMEAQSVSKIRTLKYTHFCTVSNNTVYDEDFPLRADCPRITEYLMSLWIIGMVCQECNQIYYKGFVEHMLDFYNLLDFAVLSIYIAIFTMKFWVIYKVQLFLPADRIYWIPFDPMNVLEGTFAIANILSFFRISYLLPANEILGPLQISLGRMMKDIAKFLALFVLVILAFMVGLHNLFWYYSERKFIELDLPGRPKEGEVRAEKSFGGFIETFRTVFWSLFGRGEPEAVKLGGYNNTFTEDIGYILYGAYNVAMVTVLLNMLIAMMSRSFTLIAEDSDREWKFARSLLYMDYIGDGGTLPAPLNIIGLPKAAFKLIFCSCCGCCGDSEPSEDVINDEDDLPPPEMSPVRVSNGPAARGSPRRPLAKDISLDGSSGGAYPGDNMSVVDMQVISRGSVDGTPIRSTPRKALPVASLQEEDEKLTYQQTMQRIVQRYIFDIQREAEVTEDDFDEIKQDISSIRYDFLNQMSTKIASEDEIRAAMKAILQDLQLLKEELADKTEQQSNNNDQVSSGSPDDKNDDTSSGKSQADVHVPADADTDEQTGETKDSTNAESEATVPAEHEAEDSTFNPH